MPILLPTGPSRDYVLGPSLSAPRALGAPVPVTFFQAGHGYTKGGNGANSDLNHTGDFALGSQSLKIVTDGNGTSVNVQKLAQAAINTTGKALRVWVKVPSYTHVSSINLLLGDTTFTNFYKFELYTASTPRWVEADTWQLYTLSWAEAAVTGAPTRNGVTDVRFAAVDDNTGNPVTVFFNGAALVPDGAGVWANGVVSLTFDDGHASQYTEAKKKMDAYGFPGTAYLIKDLIGSSGSYLTLAQAKALQDYSGWECAAHAYRDGTHSATFTGVSTAALNEDLLHLKEWLVTNGFTGFDHVAYPSGNWNQAVVDVVRKYFATARTTFSVRKETLAVSDRMKLRVGLVNDDTATATVQAWVDAAYTNKDWLILVFHKVVTAPASSIEYSIANFGTVIDYLNTKGIPVRTVGDVYRSLI